MRRGALYSGLNAEDALLGCERVGNEEELLSFQCSPLMDLSQNANFPQAAPLSSPVTQLPQLTSVLPLFYSPLLDRRWTPRSPAMSLSVSAASRTIPTSAAAPSLHCVEASASAGAGSTLSIDSSLAQGPKWLGRWLYIEQASNTPSAAIGAQTDISLRYEGMGAAARCSPSELFSVFQYRAPVSASRPQALSSSLRLQSSSPPGDASVSAAPSALPPRPSTSFLRTWSLALSAFCFLNGFLAFLFAWMMNTGQTAFAITAARRKWNLKGRADATRMAGFYYVVFGLLLLVNRTSALVAVAACVANSRIWGAFSNVRHFMRRCMGRLTALPICAPLLRRCTCKLNEEAALLPPARPDSAAERSASALGYRGGDGLRGFAASVPPGGQEVSKRDPKWKSNAPMKIRRRGN
ncbi:hypothetical protein ABL78_0429 [Leptomonas seymouri]|uniref:Transmembrane protein n=1 Tax=Leptomonas seymouri TaxID=5684 RepID=A0A0N0P8Y9_LEPSE|nr:hypothetical protein ABL78_0429 [Leptomonas seymouri]|eukprot:KPI90499.1 hypothetical protein ABL78_0429 [Leptomonas seymouri]